MFGRGRGAIPTSLDFADAARDRTGAPGAPRRPPAVDGAGRKLAGEQLLRRTATGLAADGRRRRIALPVAHAHRAAAPHAARENCDRLCTTFGMKTGYVVAVLFFYFGVHILTFILGENVN